MGFFKCEYQIKGEKLKDGEYVEVDINGKEKGIILNIMTLIKMKLLVGQVL